MIFFTADLHISHFNIIKYCKRPFKTVEEMNEKLIQNWNSIISKNDTVFHLGDFVFKNSNYKIYEKVLNGKIIHIKGNHDNFKTIEFASIQLEDYNIFLTHEHPNTLYAIPDFCDLVLCGHIHEVWKYKVLKHPAELNRKVLIINVGVDVWNYKPVNSNEIKEFADKIYKEEIK
jgi:calcineurin-like phosphoesterase family protein